MQATARGIVFDAYGTLFDVGSVARAAREIAPDPEDLVGLWRQKQLEYSWLRSLMGRFEDFWQVTEAGLRFAVRKLGISANEPQLARLMEAYLSLAAFPDVVPALARLEGRPLAILSNGSRRMLDSAVRTAGLAGRFAHVLSVDAVRTYKPSPAVYAMGPRALGVEAGDLLFVSSNAWDAAGAKAFGYRVCWCNRQKAPAEELGAAADLVVERLDEIPDRLRVASAGEGDLTSP